MEIDLDAVAYCHDLANHVVGGWVYWVLYIKGYLQYKDTGTIAEGNVYYDYLTKYFGPRAHDPELVRRLANPPTSTELVARQFRDFDFFRSHVTHEPEEAGRINPITVVISDPSLSADDTMIVYEVGSDAPLLASIIDGYHRLFLARLFMVERLPCKVIEEGD
jgi:hypothetical protein